MLLKLYIARNFDYVSWAFLLVVLRKLGFGWSCCEWIFILHSTARTCGMVSGTSRPPIWHRKGPRQDDPLSSMLFVIMIDVLNTKIHRAISTGILQRLTDRHMTCNVSLYVDDEVVSYHPDPYDLVAIRVLLCVFGVAFRPIMNYAKCSSTPIQYDDDHIHALRDSLACPMKEFQIPYLRLPLSVRKLPPSTLQPSIDLIDSQLLTWKVSLLPMDACLLLVHHTLSETLIHT
ncbi:uncharacterized protein [Aegilops tauschii subsp. strangulata]|uniref:uncharacterized protein n=1 Tax=Aegilops tauschii subsp. strangulata TaxID=200361 RepID=UPI003CC86785